MIPRALLCGVLTLAAVSFLPASAQAQLFRAYLAPGGNDANPCTLAQPCRLLPAALAAVGSGGEIWMLESANYNATSVNVNKSVTILAVPGVLGSVVAAGGPAISITAAGARVALRNLMIVPLPGGGGTNGIHMATGAHLTVENCLIANHAGSGVFVDGNAAATVHVANTTIRGNGNGGLVLQNVQGATVTRATISGNIFAGVQVSGSLPGTTATVDIADSTMDANTGSGVLALSDHATAVINVSVRDSRVLRNSQYGVRAISDLGAPVSLSVSNNDVIANSPVGIDSTGFGARVWAAGNTVSGNIFGLAAVGGGVFESAGDNAVRNNGTDTFGTITAIAKK